MEVKVNRELMAALEQAIENEIKQDTASKEEKFPVKAVLGLGALMAAYMICVAADKSIGLAIIALLGMASLIASSKMETEIAVNHSQVQVIGIVHIASIVSLLCSLFTRGIDSPFFLFWIFVFLGASVLNTTYLYIQLLEDGEEEKRAELLCCMAFMRAFGNGSVVGLFLAFILSPVINRNTRQRRVRR